jgi:hypothetical protein
LILSGNIITIMNAQEPELAVKSRKTSSPIAEEIGAKQPEQQQTYDWSLLNPNREYADIVQRVHAQWTELVASDANESHFQKFLAEHAGLFFGSLGIELVISQLRLGSDRLPDFVVATDHRSAGLHYEFIELERPSDSPFNKKGSPSQELTDALQQVRNWQMWLDENSEFVRRNLPATDYMRKSWSFTIIIGKRENSRQFLRERNQLSEQGPAEIRSFEYLTDRLAEQKFGHLCSSTWIHGDELTLNRLANPFFKAFTDKAWRGLLDRSRRSSGEPLSDSHFLSCYAPAVMEARKYNRLLDEFIDRINTTSR